MMEGMFALDGKVALVTGAATGLGAAAARALARQGARVAAADLADSAYEDEWELRVAIDVRDAAQREAAVAAVEREYGGVDILVNNAGINRPAPGLEITEEAWDDHFATNVKGGFFLAQRLAPGMIARGWGRVIWMSSQSGLIGIPGQPAYCASKGAVIQAVRTLGVEWARFGVTVNSVAPTFVETNMTRRRLENPAFLGFVLGKIPAGRLATADEIAAAVVFLASREAAMVNCHTLCVDGGWTAW
jgi:NAD(P)-dependent dehydrogenase (short-subunit alcohol dehydrogenase family)